MNSSKFTAEHLAHWRKHGYVLIEGFLDEDLLARAQNAIHQVMPTAEEYLAATRKYRAATPYMVEAFPFKQEVFNEITAHPDLLVIARTIMESDELRLSASQVSGKYPGSGNFEQDLHIDYHNNSVVCPTGIGPMQDLPLIIYYSDVSVETGPTYVVSTEHTRSDPLWPWLRPRSNAPQRPLPPGSAPVIIDTSLRDLTSFEHPILASAGSLFLYSMHTFHRGSSLLSATTARFTHHIGYHGPFDFLGQTSYQNPYQGVGSPEMSQFLLSASPDQRCLVGFPAPGHPYWTTENLAAVGRRYPGMDLEPYGSAIDSPKSYDTLS